MDAQGLSGSEISLHDHFTSIAMLKKYMSRTPKPPDILGEHTTSQLTKEAKSFAVLSSFQKKDLIMLSICWMTHTGKRMKDV